ncbi:MAG: FAD-dependent oxidoreductase, partial [Actinomycetales bacterium]
MTGALIVGAGLGGLRAAEALRSSGFQGAITVVGDEPHPPYNRPPLSKEALSAGVHVDELAFRRKDSVGD